MANASLQAVIHACLGEPADAGLNPRQRQVCHHILDCRTAALGGFCLECDQCQDRAFVYHACRDRHCPRCQRRASQDWCERQRAAVLPVTYHHLVFTLPDTLNGWVEVHPSLSKLAVPSSFSRSRLVAAKRHEENAGTICESLIEVSKVSTSHQARDIPCFSTRRSSAVVMSGN